MNKPVRTIIALTATGAAVLAPAAAPAAAAHPAHGGSRCAPARPGNDFYEAGVIASEPVTVPVSACTTIAVSHVRDVNNPSDTCQTFVVAFLSPGSDPTYSEPVQACSPTPRQRTVLATDVPDGTVFRVLYHVDYIEPDMQTVRYTVWR